MNALLYGATGYTGQLIARTAAGRGQPLILAGRDRAKLTALSRETGFDYRVFALDRGADVRRGVHGAAAVLNCAGPFSRTWEALSDACIGARAHYIDVTGEIDVFESLAGRGPAAREAGVMLLPGAGFDVVPSDCLARHLAERLPGALRLLLAIRGSGPLSHGTATTAVENQAGGGRARINGEIRRVPAAWKTRSVDFGDGERSAAVTIPWGDVATAYYSTGIANVEVYAALPPRLIRLLRVSRYMSWVLRASWLQSLQKRAIDSRPAGPSPHELAHGESRVWGRVEGVGGTAAEAVVTGPNGYRLTADAALHVLRRALAGDAPPGYQTPSTAYGADLILEVGGTRFDMAPEA
jgi:short subunit dehydrogenase-like uncharacterized protein